MKTITMIEAKKWIEDAIGMDLVFGLRGDWFCPESNFENSSDWDDGFKLDRKINGLCAIEIDCVENIEWAFDEVKKYGDTYFLIIGDYKNPGNDTWANEIIISNHSIYAKIID